MIEFNILASIVNDSIDQLSRYIKEPGQSILLLTSPSVLKYINSTTLIDELKKRHDLRIIEDIKPNAPISQLDSIIENFEKPSLLIAIGGGSVIDSAKALSVCWDGGSVSDYFYKRRTLSSAKIPLIAVPSTAGTGAELSYGAILEDSEKKVKGGLRGQIVQCNQVLIDINLYMMAPERLKAEVGFDCLTHAIETYLSKSTSPVVRYQSIAAISTVFQHLEHATTGASKESMEKMALASMMMGINLAKSSTCLPHRIQYVIGPITNTSHAQGLIMLYKGWLPIIAETSDFAYLSRDLGFSRNEFVQKIENLKIGLDIDYRLGDYLDGFYKVEELAKKVTGKVELDPCYQGIDTIENIIRESL